MKKIALALLVIGAIGFMSFGSAEPIVKNNASFTSYCDGWSDGYCEGYRDVRGQNALCPLTPLCPLAKLQCNEGYKCGYNRGFKAGMKRGRQ